MKLFQCFNVSMFVFSFKTLTVRQVDLDKVNADDKFVPFSALRVLQEIGRGAFGSVYKVGKK